MKRFILIVFVGVALMTLRITADAKPFTDPHWTVTRHTASGKHVKREQGWPRDRRCSGVSHGQYEKRKNVEAKRKWRHEMYRERKKLDKMNYAKSRR